MSETPPEAESDVEAFGARRRRLCPDGGCVGLIGPDGRCRVCGLEDSEAPAGLGADAFAGGCASDDDFDDADSGHHTGEHLGADAIYDVTEGGPDFDPARKLCPDGDCVGVLGDNGRCKVCGRDGAAPAPE
jgi:hypothetical protein